MGRALLIALVLAGVAATPTAAADLASLQKKEIAMRLVSSAENSSLKWKEQYRYIEDIRDGRGYTAGIIGFCSGTGVRRQLRDPALKAARPRIAQSAAGWY